MKISIVEDHPDYRIGLSHLLNASDGFECVSVFSNAEDAVNDLNGKEDALLLDINLPNLSGVDAIPLIKEKHPKLKIIMLTVQDDENSIIKAIINGADGYLLKKTEPAKVLSALKECLDGGSPMTAIIASKVIKLFKKHIPQQSEDFTLTARELEVLHLLVDGLDTRTIGEKLFVSIDTVRNHLRHIYHKLHVHSKSQAVVKAVREGLI